MVAKNFSCTEPAVGRRSAAVDCRVDVKEWEMGDGDGRPENREEERR